MELTAFFYHALKVFNLPKIAFNKPIAIIACLPAFAIPVFSPTIKALILLGGFFCLDFITGILASWVEFKKAAPLVPASGKRYLIQSTKLRLSGVKFICYSLGTLCAWGIETVFVIKEIPSGHVSTQNLTLTTVVIAFFCMIEFYSVFFENVKRMGFDIIQEAKKVFKLYKSIKDETNGTN